MAQSDKVGKFKITVKLDNTIQAEQEPNEGAIEDCKIKDDLLRLKTVEILIDMLRDSRLRSRKEFEFLGENLYSILLENKIGEALYKAIYANAAQMDYWRVELEFKSEKTVQHPLASWPWEYLYLPTIYGWGGGNFLAEEVNLVLTRRLTTPFGTIVRNLLVPEQEEIKVLFVAPSPRSLSPVAYGPVLETLETLKADPKNRIMLTTLVDPYSSEKNNDTSNSQSETKYEPQATFSKFVHLVRTLNPHVIHFIGHGRSNNEEGGQLAFMHETVQGKERWVGEKELASKLMGTALRLVFLQACESALPASSYSPYEIASGAGFLHNPYEAISGVAMQIANRNIPAVVAMQYRINSLVANKFSEAFYKALVGSKSVDVAMQAGRLEILTEVSEWAKTSSFGLPVLYLREPGALRAPKIETELAGLSQSIRSTDSGNITTTLTPTGVQASDSFNVSTGGGSMPPPGATTVASQGFMTPGNLQWGADYLSGAPQELRCPWCNQLCDPSDDFCVCGKPLMCPDCRTRVTKIRSNCGHCNKPLPIT